MEKNYVYVNSKEDVEKIKLIMETYGYHLLTSFPDKYPYALHWNTEDKSIFKADPRRVSPFDFSKHGFKEIKLEDILKL